ncbi:NADH-cytochrome b5 reductase-like [Malaya genurostris]|uniref:NADH-cytochrome b5 reductase-like n=1 Tax=Malaya genurostris TaxID=325434 RepID=UPI0026F3D58E|nr:NADH-cytochrome b5 reductase-like [Malaya genurostris]
MESEEISSECCGSGCTNCILDQIIRSQNLIRNVDESSILPIGYYRAFKCTLIEQIMDNTFLFRFRLVPTDEEQQKQLIVAPGSHLMLRIFKNWRFANRPFNSIFSKWRSSMAQFKNTETRDRRRVVEKHDKTELDLYLSRPYTPIRVNCDEKSFDVLIKLESGGEMSEYLLTLHTDDVTEWKGAYTGFFWKRNMHKHLFGFVQGVGLAPVYSIMANILNDEEDETLLNLWYCCKDMDSILLRSDLQAMSHYWNFKSVIYLSREKCSCGGRTSRNCLCLSSKKRYNEQIFNHRLEKQDIQNLLEKVAPDSVQVLICGNESFAELIVACITELHIENYYKF